MLPTVILSLCLMLATWVLICIIGHGYANSIDHISYLLHRHAEKMRGMHRRREAVVQERWIKCLEGGAVDTVLKGIERSRDHA